MKKLLKEPLLHFMLIGAGLFGLYALVNSDEDGNAERIVVSKGRIDQIIGIYQKTWQRPPSESELKSLIDDYVLEEIYYRQAVELGIDKDDTIIRRRMRQKYEFITDQAIIAAEASDEELEQYMQENAGKFSKDPTISLEHVYINPQKHSGNLEEYLKTSLAKLKSGEEVQSDSYLIPRTYDATPAWKIDRDFGAEFSNKIQSLKRSEWSGPIDSGLGVHFVKVTASTQGELPPLVEIRDKVAAEWAHDEKLKIRSQINDQFLEKYEVVIEWPQKEKDA